MAESHRVDLAVQAKTTAELRSTVRVYVKEWIFDSRHVTEGEARVVSLMKYAERVQPDDIEVRKDEIRNIPFELWVRLWNLKGEFKHEDDARGYAAGLWDDVRVVDRNSREEHVLLNYGKVKLPT